MLEFADFEVSRYPLIRHCEIILESEQDAQDTAIENAESLANRLNERLSKMEAQDEANNQVLENLKNDLDELNKLFEDHEKRLEKCVNWDQLENSFTKDFFNENEDASRKKR